MYELYLAAGVLALLIFLFLKPRLQVSLAFIIMSNGFDLLPSTLAGQKTWDYGAILLLISSIGLAARRRQQFSGMYKYAFIRILSVFFIWLLFCLAYSLLIFDYPLLLTIKNSRELVIGYFTLFVFILLFSVDKYSLSIMLKWLYGITFVLLIVTLIQRVKGIELLFGLYAEYGEITRYLPSYLPISLLFFWVISSKYLSSGKVPIHALAYLSLVVAVVALTYTRGIYIVFAATSFLLVIMLFKQKLIKLPYVAIASFILLAFISVAGFSGWLDNVVQRGVSGIELVFSKKQSNEAKGPDADTYSNRLNTVKERFELVVDNNPYVGYGFMHETLVPYSLRKILRYGSPLSTPEYKEKYKLGMPYVLALYSTDIGWGDLVIKTGIIGFTLFLMFVVVFAISFIARAKYLLPGNAYHIALGFYLQTIVLIVLMFNGNTFTRNLHIPMFMIAAYTFVLSKQRTQHHLSFLGLENNES